MPSSPSPERRRADAASIFQTAVEAADPSRCVQRVLERDGNDLRVAGSSFAAGDLSRIVVAGAGKATPAMAAAVESVLGDLVSAGHVNTKYGHSVRLERITTTECGHPLPDAAGVEGTEAMVSLLDQADDRTLVLCLFSGGGSALMPAPAEGLNLEEKQQTTQLLLECGATIDEINTVRKHLSRTKGGLLARAAQPASVVSLMVSDVIGDRLETIASGPTCPDPTTFRQSMDIVERYGICPRLPKAVRSRLETGLAGGVPETPKGGDPCFARVANHVIGNNTLSLEAARAAAQKLGYRTLVLSSRIAGETRDIAGMHAAIAEEVAAAGQPLPPPACLISGGETTVTIRGKGKGGRNQEFALAAALHLAGNEHITVLSGGTDGTDGPTDAAGAIADGSTTKRGHAAGLDAADHLSRNDSYHFFQPLGDLLMTGPTGTNVMDLRLLLIT